MEEGSKGDKSAHCLKNAVDKVILFEHFSIKWEKILALELLNSKIE